MIVTAHLISDSFILNSTVSLSGWKERQNNQTKHKAYLFVFCKGLLLQQIPAQCSSSRSFNTASWSNILFVNFESTCLESCFLVVWVNLEMERFCFEIITVTWTKMIFFAEMCRSRTVSNVFSFCSLPSLFVNILKIQCDRYGKLVKYRFFYF